jgi:hypothetical protein
MRDSIRRLRPEIHTSGTGRRYAWLNLGKLSRVEDGGYKLEGPIFATSDIDRQGIHRAIDQLMERLDQTLDETPPSESAAR